MAFLSLSLCDTPGLAHRINVLFWGPGDFPVSYSTGITLGTLEIVEVLWSTRGSYSTIWSFPFTNVKRHSDPWPVTVTSQPIRLSPISWPWYRAWSSPNYECFRWSICKGCGMPAGNAYPSGHLVPSPFFGTCLCSNCLDQFSRTCRVFSLDFSPWIPLGIFLILLNLRLELPDRCLMLSGKVFWDLDLCQSIFNIFHWYEQGNRLKFLESSRIQKSY